MLVYTLILVPLTIMPSVFGALGLLYGIVAALLGARFLWYCIAAAARDGRHARLAMEDVPLLSCSTWPCSSWRWGWIAPYPWAIAGNRSPRSSSSTVRMRLWSPPPQLSIRSHENTTR